MFSVVEDLSKEIGKKTEVFIIPNCRRLMLLQIFIPTNQTRVRLDIKYLTDRLQQKPDYLCTSLNSTRVKPRSPKSVSMNL